MKVTLICYFFYRKSLFELKSLRCCPFTLWAYRYVKCHCDCRFGIFNLVIADWIKFQNYEDFDPIEANNQFIRTYNAILDRNVLFQNINEFPEELQLR